MALERLTSDLAYRWHLASPLAIADIENPSITELNANPTNDPSGLIWNLSCALDTGTSQFDLDDPEIDDSTTFCQIAGSGDVLSRSATVVFGFNEAKERWTDATSTAEVDGFNQATLAKSLLAWRGIEYYAILSVGKQYDAAFEIGDPLKIVRVSTDVIASDISTGSPIVHTQSFGFRSDIAWNVRAVA